MRPIGGARKCYQHLRAPNHSERRGSTMAKAVQLHDLPRVKRGLPEYPKFIFRTVRIPRARGGQWKALWRCRCGVEFESFVSNVTGGHTKSCGCDQVAARTLSFPIHGHFIGDKPSPTYKSWQAMIARCTNPKHPAFHKYYAGRGVTICDQWLKSFPQFLADVGERPEGMTLDRVDPSGNYEPANVRWADYVTQRKNRRS